MSRKFALLLIVPWNYSEISSTFLLHTTQVDTDDGTVVRFEARGNRCQLCLDTQPLVSRIEIRVGVGCHARRITAIFVDRVLVSRTSQYVTTSG
jgi:hypothetical protein